MRRVRRGMAMVIVAGGLTTIGTAFLASNTVSPSGAGEGTTGVTLTWTRPSSPATTPTVPGTGVAPGTGTGTAPSTGVAPGTGTGTAPGVPILTSPNVALP